MRFCQSCGTQGHDGWQNECPIGTIPESDDDIMMDNPMADVVSQEVEVGSMSPPEDCVLISHNVRNQNRRGMDHGDK